MREKLFPYIIALSALSISGCAAFYSVYGLSMLFAGASTAVVIMASALEASKLVIASALYQYWSDLAKSIKTYLIAALLVLITITSGGIYGFLSGAYQETSAEASIIDKQIELLEAKKNRFEERLSDEKESIMFFTEALSNPTKVQYVDRETGQLVTTTSSRQRKLLETQLDEAKNLRLALEDSVSVYEIKVLDARINNQTTRELGPLKYMAELTNQPMDTIINWFMLLIIFVFDPLAIVLVVIANMAFSIKQIRKEKAFVDHLNTSASVGADLVDEIQKIGDILASGNWHKAGTDMQKLKDKFKDKFNKGK